MFKLKVTALKLLLVIFALASITLLVQQTVAAEVKVTSLQDAGIDDSIVQSDQSYTLPNEIVVTPIFQPDQEAELDYQNWYKGLYYYLIANDNRPGFTDVPFHYAVTKDGKVFAGNSGGDERKVSIEGVGNSMVSIMYLAGKSENSFDPRARDALKELILDVANRNQIDPNNTKVTSVEYVRDEDKQLIFLQKRQLYGLWENSLNNIVESIAGQYDPISKDYQVEVTGVEATGEQVVGGSTTKAAITVSNTGKYGIYAGTEAEILGTSQQSTSKFYTTNEWASTSQFYLMPEQGALLPGESNTYEVTLSIPLRFDEQTETFQLRTVGGKTIPNSEFVISLDVQRPEGTIVEIAETGVGWLRVRSAPTGGVDNEIARATVGNRYFKTDDAGNGWIEIKLKDGRKGWVAERYTREV